MRSPLLACLWIVAACNPAQFQQEKLNDGSIKVTCELSMDECVRRAQDLCRNQRYRIIEGTSETRLRDVPPFEHAYHTSRLHFICTDDGGKPLLSLDAAPPADAKPAAPRACTAGETRECVGPAACKGGQACVADGSGFGPCDCGPVPPPVSTPATAPIAPAEPNGPVTPTAPAP
jgi:hypothetical protein